MILNFRKPVVGGASVPEESGGGREFDHNMQDVAVGSEHGPVLIKPSRQIPLQAWQQASL